MPRNRLFGRGDTASGALAKSPVCGKYSRRTGQPCKSLAVLGSTVCRMHGGSAPQVKKAAGDRLALMVDSLISEMYRIAISDKSSAVRVQAAKDLLDRAGLKPKERVEMASIQQFTLRISRDVDDSDA